MILDSSDEMWQVMQLCHRLHRQMYNRLTQIGLYRGQPPILHFLMQKGTMNQKELAQLLEISPATVTVALKRMEKSGLIQRTVDKEDQRSLCVQVTDYGRRMGQQAQEILQEMSDNFTACLSSDEAEIFRNIVAKLMAATDTELDQEGFSHG